VLTKHKSVGTSKQCHITLRQKERLKYLKLQKLKYWQHRRDMTETYKILHGLYDTAVAPSLMISQVSRALV